MSVAVDALRTTLAPLGEDLLSVAPTVTGQAPYAEVAPARWVQALTLCRDGLGLTWFDWLGAVDDVDRVRVLVSLLAPDGPHRGRGVVLAAPMAADSLTVPTATTVFAGASWHEREAHEMFGIGFDGHADLRPLLLPEGFQGHPMRKDFVLASRVARPWPGEHEPSGRTRRRALPPGVPEPGTWGPAPEGPA